MTPKSPAPTTSESNGDGDQSLPNKIVIVSDGTGETATQMLKAAMVQFREKAIFSRYNNVREESLLDAICEEAAREDALIVFTIVQPELRAAFLKLNRQYELKSVDLLGPLLQGLATLFGHSPKFVAGLLHDVNEAYFHRIQAMEYTIAHDDGKDLTHLEQADLVILGISRTSKTPLSMYLSHQGWRVANVPLIRGFDVPKEVYEVDQKRVICLTINPESLTTIRMARLQRLGQDKGGDYADLEKVNEEIEWANELFRQNRKWPVFNVTAKALEETASEILRLMTSRGLSPENRALVDEKTIAKHGQKK